MCWCVDVLTYDVLNCVDDYVDEACADNCQLMCR
jgi:hypothetical protein